MSAETNKVRKTTKCMRFFLARITFIYLALHHQRVSKFKYCCKRMKKNVPRAKGSERTNCHIGRRGRQTNQFVKVASHLKNSTHFIVLNNRVLRVNLVSLFALLHCVQ